MSRRGPLRLFDRLGFRLAFLLAVALFPLLVLAIMQSRSMLSEAQAGIVESVEHAIALAGGDAAFPLLITTADNVLAESGYLQGVHRDALASEGDAVVVLATRESIRAAHALAWSHDGELFSIALIDTPVPGEQRDYKVLLVATNPS